VKGHLRKDAQGDVDEHAAIGNTEDARRKEIQRIVRFVANHYEQRIHARLLELGVKGFIWTPDGLHWDQPRPEPESHCSIVLQD
jgi:hypothetical protein